MNERPPIPTTRMHESWQPPPELATATLPRRFRWKVAGFANMGLTVVIFVVGLGVLGGSWRSADEGHRLKQEGQVTDAKVTRTWTEPARRGFHYNVAYEFSTDGRTVTGESELLERNWKGLQAGSHTAVRYVPGQLEYNRLALARETYVLPYWVPLGVLAFWIFMLALAVYPIRKERRLLMYGLAAPGWVTSSPAGFRPKYGYVTKYEFQLSDGTVVQGKTQRDRRFYHGEEVVVLYDAKHPRRSEIYPTRLARIPS